MFPGIFNKQRSSIILPDYDGYDITHIWSLHKSQQASFDYCLYIKDSSGSGTNQRYVFYDDNGGISLDSPIGISTTPHVSQTLQYYIDSIMTGTTVYVRAWYCQISGLQVDGGTTFGGAKIYDTTNGLATKNGKVAIRFTSSGSMVRAAMSGLADGNNYSLTAVCSSETSLNASGIFSSANTSTARVSMYCDRRTQKRMGVIGATTTNGFVDLDAQDNTANQRCILFTVDSSKNMGGYKNGSALAMTDTYAGTYTNDLFRIGADISDGQALDGYMQWFSVHSTEQTSGEASGLYALLDNYFSF